MATMKFFMLTLALALIAEASILVELRGFEPLACYMRSNRSTN